MTLKSELLLTTLYGFFKLTTQSIAGVTYMDDFDFEERYRNVYECNPFYWHPLHMPEHCTQIFEELIREGIGAIGPARIVKEKKGPYYVLSDEDDDTMAPYEKMVELLKKDVIREPSEAEITFVPGLGAAAVYNQPVSRKSGDYIKAVAKAYKDISFGFGPLYNPIESFTTTEKVIDNEQRNEIDKILKNFKMGSGSLRNQNTQNKPKYNIKKKINKKGLVTVLRTKHH